MVVPAEIKKILLQTGFNLTQNQRKAKGAFKSKRNYQNDHWVFKKANPKTKPVVIRREFRLNQNQKEVAIHHRLLVITRTWPLNHLFKFVCDFK
jgi:hypothetical protein